MNFLMLKKLMANGYPLKTKNFTSYKQKEKELSTGQVAIQKTIQSSKTKNAESALASISIFYILALQCGSYI